jgi:hypothetical protein
MVSRRIINRLLVVPLLIIVMMVAVLGWRWHIDRQGRKQLEAVVAKLDETDARWRWEDIEADRPEIPDAENSSIRVAEFRLAVTNNLAFHFVDVAHGIERDDLYRDLYQVAPNRLHTPQAYVEIDRELQRTENGWPVIEHLSRCKRGKQTLVPAATWSKRRLSVDEWPHDLLEYLKWESERTALTDDRDRQATLLIAMLNLGRIEGGDPFINMWSRRGARLELTCERLERLLALDRLGAILPRLQTELTVEANADLFRPAVRDERAQLDRTIRAIDTGELPLSLEDFPPKQKQSIRDQGLSWMYRPHLAADWAATLELSTRCLALADQPIETQLAAFGNIPAPSPIDRFPFANICHHWIKDEINRLMYTKAVLRCAVAALAVERFRLLTGDWPTSLDAIPTAILSAVPLDPFTGNYLKFARRVDGVTVYSVGRNGIDDGGSEKSDIVFRLFDSNQRRLPPLTEYGPRPRRVVGP